MRQGAKVQLDRERRLRYTLGAIEEIQERYDVDLVAGDNFDFGNLDDIAWLVCLGLRHAGETMGDDLGWWARLLVRFGFRDPPRITETWVKQHVDLQNLTSVTAALGHAMGSADIEESEELDMDPTVAPPIAVNQ